MAKANGQQKLIKLLETSNNLFEQLQDINQSKLNINFIPPENMKEAKKMIKNLGSRNLLKLVKEIEQRLYDNN